MYIFTFTYDDDSLISTFLISFFLYLFEHSSVTTGQSTLDSLFDCPFDVMLDFTWLLSPYRFRSFHDGRPPRYRINE